MANDPSKPHSGEFETCSSDVIFIESDMDFEDYELIGNGTIGNPYIIANETIVGSRCIVIHHTRSYFRIVDCTLNADEYGISLVNVENAEITGNTIYSKSRGIAIDMSNSCIIANNTIKADYEVIRVSESTPCTIANNSIFCSGDTSVYIENSINSTIIANTILSSWDGLASVRCNGSSILNNTIACDYQAIRIGLSSNNSIVGNRFASNIGSIAIDYYGSDNSWDNGISLGNAWFDYLGYGEYNISGNTNSIDHFPTRFEPSFPMDFKGPYIDAALGHLDVDFLCDFPESWRFTAIVNDSTGVDTVIIIVNGIAHFMSYQPTNENPDQYVYDYPNPRSLRYSYWANDSLGWSTETEEGYISMGVFSCSESTNSSIDTNSLSPEIIMVIGGSSLLVIVLVFVLFSKKRRSL